MLLLSVWSGKVGMVMPKFFHLCFLTVAIKIPCRKENLYLLVQEGIHMHCKNEIVILTNLAKLLS